MSPRKGGRTFIGGGSGGGGGGASELEALTDVDLDSVEEGQVLVWNGTGWVNDDPASTGASDLEGLSDVDLTNPADNQVLTFDGSDWVNDDIPEVEGFSWAGHWDSATAYEAGELVDRSGSVYRALTGSQDSDPADPPGIQNVAGSNASGNGSSCKFWTLKVVPTTDITFNVLQVGCGGSGNIRVGIAEDFTHAAGFNTLEEFPWIDDVDGNPVYVDGDNVGGTAIDLPLAADVQLQEGVAYQFVAWHRDPGHLTWTAGGRNLTGAVDGDSGDTGTLGFHADPGTYEVTPGQGAYPKWLLRYDAATWEELFALDAPHDHDDDYEAAGAVATHAATTHGSTNLEGLSDVDLTTPAEDQVLTYDGSQWVNADPAGGGGGGDLTWIGGTFQNSWANYGSGLQGWGYAKDSDNVVHLRGTLDPGSSGIIMVLDEGYRPAANEIFFVYSETDNTYEAGALIVRANGEVAKIMGGTTMFSIAGVTFAAAP